MKPLGTSIVLIASLCVCGCSATPYQRAGPSFGHGYSDKRLSPDTFHVLFTANYATSAETMQEYLYRRAAELASRHGFRYFAVIRPPRPLIQYRSVYQSQADREAAIDSHDVELPVWGTQHMTIQCFHRPQDAPDVRLVDVRTCLLGHLEPLPEQGNAWSHCAPCPWVYRLFD